MCLCAGFSSVQEIPRFMVLALVLVMVFVIVLAAVGYYFAVCQSNFQGIVRCGLRGAHSLVHLSEKRSFNTCFCGYIHNKHTFREP